MCLRAGDRLENEHELGIFWNEVVEVPLCLVNSG